MMCKSVVAAAKHLLHDLTLMTLRTRAALPKYRVVSGLVSRLSVTPFNTADAMLNTDQVQLSI